MTFNDQDMEECPGFDSHDPASLQIGCLTNALHRSSQGKWSKSTCGGCSSVKPLQQ